MEVMDAMLSRNIYEMPTPKQFSVKLGPMRPEIEKLAKYYGTSMARMLLIAAAIGVDVLREDGDIAWPRGVRVLRDPLHSARWSHRRLSDTRLGNPQVASPTPVPVFNPPAAR